MADPATARARMWNTNVKLLLLFALTLTCARAQESATDNSGRILSLETLWNQAELKQDIQALQNLLAENFIYVDVDGSSQNKAEFLDGVRNRPEHIDALGLEPASSKVYVYENSAIATGIYRERGTLHGKRYAHRGRFTDTWVKQGSAWVCVASQSTLIQK